MWDTRSCEETSSRHCVGICDSHLVDENEKSAKDQYEESRVVGHISLRVSKSGQCAKLSKELQQAPRVQ
jgi:hypothetical protein